MNDFMQELGAVKFYCIVYRVKCDQNMEVLTKEWKRKNRKSCILQIFLYTFINKQ